ncbi:hypothetical protein [Rhizobium sp.]
MAKINIEKNRTTALDISTSNNTITLAKGYVFDSSSYGIFEGGNTSGNRYIINGTMITHGSSWQPLSLNGDNSTLIIGRQGKLESGDWAMSSFGDDNRIVNNGRIESEDAAFAIVGNGNHITNRGTIVTKFQGIDTDKVSDLRVDNQGTIKAGDGLMFRAEDLTLNLGKDSVLKFGYGGSIDTSNASADSVSRINNAGSISHAQDGMIASISGGMGREIVRNTGTMDGFVSLDAGNDVYDGRGGRLFGTVLGGDGNDKFYLSNSKDKVAESAGWGYDKLYVSASYTLGANNEIEEMHLLGKGDFNLTGNELDNRLFGNKGDNRLIGGGGSDGLWGGAGKDVITGGMGADAFHFKPNAGREIITDFTDGEDILVLSPGQDIKSIADLLANHVYQDGKDLVISGDGTEMILRNVDKSQITALDWDT